MTACIVLFQATSLLELTDLELGQIGKTVQTRSKVEELVEILEMSYSLKALANDPAPACTVLFNWSKEMKMRRYPNIRLHLVHHLETIGMHDIAYRYARILITLVCLLITLSEIDYKHLYLVIILSSKVSSDQPHTSQINTKSPHLI